ncbi:MAG: 16S rRNA (adenine(1518)-N(6)/adenine(1519)-N(6))-dimethyltransferase RsmA [Tepidiformaceae bacterium]
MTRTRLPGPRPRKALGQHFLRDSGVLADIVAAVRVPQRGIVVEIGAGTGQLTAAILDAGHTVVAIEVEPRMLAHLSSRLGRNPRLQIVEADARLADLSELVPAGVPFVVAGNLPYFAANPIVRHLLEGYPKPKEMVIMVQREVAREIAAKPGHSSLFTISVQVYAEAELLFDVHPTAFDPPPAVFSSVVRLVLRDPPLVPVKRIEPFFTLVSKTFRNPRKQIHNALARETGLTVEEADEVLSTASIDPMRRAETLSIDEWLGLLDARERVIGGD